MLFAMAPLVIEGETLGQIHQKYNKIVKEAIENNETEISDLNFEDSDLDNLLKIDIASKNQNFEFILKVLKCHDMLYVSRAIKRSTWLITDEQYAHIINPENLFKVLKPQMSIKSFNKLILHIRLNLRDEKRVEDFYNHYKDSDLKTAMKWLPHCSNAFIEKVLIKHANDSEITNDLVKRLCEKSVAFLDIYCRHNKQYYKREALFQAMFIMKTDVEQYLNIIEAMHPNDMPYFKAKYTKILMTKCPERVMKNLKRYANCIDLQTFAKYLSQEETKEFILININNKILCGSWGGNDKLKHFFHRLPTENRFEFIKQTFIDKQYKKDASDDFVPYRCDQMYCPIKPNPGTSQNIYSWYIFAPFPTAFTDLKKLIRTESNPSERIAILSVMLTTAGRNMENIHTLIKYYRENHINEPFKFKIQFINTVLKKTNAYKFDKQTWHYLKEIFTSMEVYSETDKNVLSCVVTVFLYCIINDEEVPKIIKDKFEFQTMSNYKNNLTEEENIKVFNYLFNYLDSKIQNKEIKNEKQFSETLCNVDSILHLLKDWDKHLKDYPLVLEKIQQMIAISEENTDWNINISCLYNVNKSWRKLLFTESLIVSPGPASVVNTLKHDPTLIEKHRVKIDELLKNNINLDTFFKKVRVYWPHSLAKTFKEVLMNNLKQHYNHKPFMTGLFTLLPPKEVTVFIKEYVPSESKIDWSQYDEVQLNIRKFLAMSLHIARPQPPLEMALLYAKGDYLQYALPSLNAILYNMSSAEVKKNLVKLLNAPVSLQKHGIRTAILKLKHDDLKQILSDIWKSNKNSSIRADIFVQTYNMLCKERNEETIKKKWELLKMFIDNLTAEEDKKIYTCLSKFENVPMCIRGECWMKSYAFLNSLPVKANCDSLVDHLIYNMTDIMLQLDDDFVTSIFMKSFNEMFSKKYYPHAPYVASFLLSAKTGDAQMLRYEKLLLPMLERSVTEWDQKNNNEYYVRCNIYEIIKYMSENFEMVLRNDLVFPTKMFEEILNFLQNKLPETENYILITVQKMALRFITILEKAVTEEKEKRSSSVVDDKSSPEHDLLSELRKNVAQRFSELCQEHLKEDVTKYFSSIYLLFVKAFDQILRCYKYTEMEKLESLKHFLCDKDFIEGHLLVLQYDIGYLNDDEKTFKEAILETIKENPNKEIQMHYWLYKH